MGDGMRAERIFVPVPEVSAAEMNGPAELGHDSREDEVAAEASGDGADPGGCPESEVPA